MWAIRNISLGKHLIKEVILGSDFVVDVKKENNQTAVTVIICVFNLYDAAASEEFEYLSPSLQTLPSSGLFCP